MARVPIDSSIVVYPTHALIVFRPHKHKFRVSLINILKLGASQYLVNETCHKILNGFSHVLTK